MDTTQLIKQFSLFEKLDRQGIWRISQLFTAKEFTQGENLILEGQSGTGCFVITEGEVEIIKNTKNGEKILKTLSTGEIIGEIAMIDGGTHIATVRAKTNVKTLHISEWDFKAQLEAYPEIALQLLPIIAGRLRESLV